MRASAVFALGRLIANTGDRSDHANMVDHGIATTLASTVGQDGSPLVRMVFKILISPIRLIIASGRIDL